MVSKILAICIFLSFSGFIHAKDREITSIEILETGVAYEGHSKIEQKVCSFFQPTKKQLIEYFEKSDWLNEGGEISHQYYSPCIVIGKVTFKNGISVKWTIQSSGYGYGVFNYNKNMIFFRKNNEWFDPFQCTYSMGDDEDDYIDCEDEVRKFMGLE